MATRRKSFVFAEMARAFPACSLTGLASLSAACVLLMLGLTQLIARRRLEGYHMPITSFRPNRMSFVPEERIPWNEIREPEIALREKLAALPRFVPCKSNKPQSALTRA